MQPCNTTQQHKLKQGLYFFDFFIFFWIMANENFIIFPNINNNWLLEKQHIMEGKINIMLLYAILQVNKRQFIKSNN